MGDEAVNIVIPNIDQQWYEYFGILDIVWLIDEIFVWLRGGQEAITRINIEDNTYHFQTICKS